MSNRKLTQDERDLLIDIMQHPGIKVFMSELDTLTQTIETDVLKLSLDSSTERELLVRKARAEGARRLYDATIRRLQSLKAGK